MEQTLKGMPQEAPDEGIRAEANRLLEQILPTMLRFMADEYDDTSSTVFPLLQALLASVSEPNPARLNLDISGL